MDLQRLNGQLLGGHRRTTAEWIPAQEGGWAFIFGWVETHTAGGGPGETRAFGTLKMYVPLLSS